MQYEQINRTLSGRNCKIGLDLCRTFSDRQGYILSCAKFRAINLFRTKRFQCAARGLADARCVGRPGKDKTMFSIRIAVAALFAACLVTGASAAEKAKPAAGERPRAGRGHLRRPPGAKHASGYRRRFPEGHAARRLRAGCRLPGYTPDGETRRAACHRTASRSRRGAVDRYDHAQRASPRGTSRTTCPTTASSWARSRRREGNTRSCSSASRRKTTPRSGSSPRRPSSSCPRSTMKSTSPGSSGTCRRR